MSVCVFVRERLCVYACVGICVYMCRCVGHFSEGNSREQNANHSGCVIRFGEASAQVAKRLKYVRSVPGDSAIEFITYLILFVFFHFFRF